jgi:hypothetical protein
MNARVAKLFAVGVVSPLRAGNIGAVLGVDQH